MSDTQSYRFSTFQELVDIVPADRISDCMTELGEILQAAKATAELTIAVAEDLARADGKKVQKCMSAITLPDAFTWRDDGKRELGATLAIEGRGPFMDVRITNKKGGGK